MPKMKNVRAQDWKGAKDKIEGLGYCVTSVQEKDDGNFDVGYQTTGTCEGEWTHKRQTHSRRYLPGPFG